MTALSQDKKRGLESILGIVHGQQTAAIACVLDHERFQETHVTIKLRHEAKEVWCDQERIAKLGDYLGRFPVVVFSSQDLQLVRGSPAQRRRWLDVTLAAIGAGVLWRAGRVVSE